MSVPPPPPPLPTGDYTIVNRGDFVGDRRQSGLMPPWPVILFPRGHKPVIWLLERLPDGNYFIKTEDHRLGAVDRERKVFVDQGNGEEWRLEHVPAQGPHAYHIVKVLTTERWVALKPDEQIVLLQPNEANANDVFDILPILKE
ncbi:hypothetical protein AX16_010923 [Volvariella volvacea WC 439]|nr:hypothetical protein AX16_010923 [Volvariella volvacea WC 439]